MVWRLIFVSALASLFATGCRGSMIVVGNLASMVIVAVMLWSTLNMKQS